MQASDSPKNNLAPALFSLTIAVILGIVVFGYDSAADTPRRDFYFPNTEPLDENEIRVIALGTGSPNFRPAQASAGWLIELGSGEKFIFDIGTGAVANLGALEIPFNHLNKVFISHLHLDHIGDLDALYIGGWVSQRTIPLEIYGPSGRGKKFGIAYAVEHMQEMFNWDVAGRKGGISSSGTTINVHEFDYSKTHVVYDNNGVVIKSWPAIHTIDGAVSFSLEWKGLKFVYSGDTAPNQWFMEEGQNADLLIHECYFTEEQLMQKKDYTAERAHTVGSVLHTSPTNCGKIFAALEPRFAVPYHIFTDFDIAPDVIADMRKSYGGKMALADDMMVWNITKDEIVVRMTVYPDEVWPATDVKAGPPTLSERIKRSDWLEAGRLDLDKD